MRPNRGRLEPEIPGAKDFSNSLLTISHPRPIYLVATMNGFVAELIRALSNANRNGKPVVRPGRKAMGLAERDRQAAEFGNFSLS